MVVGYSILQPFASMRWLCWLFLAMTQVYHKPRGLIWSCRCHHRAKMLSDKMPMKIFLGWLKPWKNKPTTRHRNPVVSIPHVQNWKQYCRLTPQRGNAIEILPDWVNHSKGSSRIWTRQTKWATDTWPWRVGIVGSTKHTQISRLATKVGKIWQPFMAASLPWSRKSHWLHWSMATQGIGVQDWSLSKCLTC